MGNWLILIRDRCMFTQRSKCNSHGVFLWRKKSAEEFLITSIFTDMKDIQIVPKVGIRVSIRRSARNPLNIRSTVKIRLEEERCGSDPRF